MVESINEWLDVVVKKVVARIVELLLVSELAVVFEERVVELLVVVVVGERVMELSGVAVEGFAKIFE